MEINLKDVSVVFSRTGDQHFKALNKISFLFKQGETVALMGPTGSGKSTLLRVMAGLIKPTSGQLSLSGDLQSVILSIQEPHRGFFAATVREEVAFGPENLRLSQSEVKERTKWALTAVELPKEKWEVPPFLLSGGEQRRVALASVLAMKPQILLLDEPTIGLDGPGKQNLISLLKKINNELGVSLLIASHDPDFLFSLTRRVLLLDRGQLQMDTTWGALVKKTRELKKTGLELPLILRVLLQLKEKGVPVDPGQDQEAKARGELEKLVKEESEGVWLS